MREKDGDEDNEAMGNGRETEGLSQRQRQWRQIDTQKDMLRVRERKRESETHGICSD